MKKTIVYAAVASAFLSAGVAQASQATPFSASTVEQSDAIEGAFNIKSVIAESHKVDDSRVRVIIQLNDSPMAQFQGVNPAVSKINKSNIQVDFNSDAAESYRSFLEREQNAFIQQAKAIDKSFDVDFRYFASFNGFAATVDKDALERISQIFGVKAIYPDAVQHAQMDASLDLINVMEVWEQLGGNSEAGKGVKVAIVDSGIRPENPLFSGEGFEAPSADTLPTDDYCSEVPDFCNNKLIVARNAPVPDSFAVVPEEHDSPLGFNGHGTHVAGTAVGNSGVIASRDGAEAEISGVAPAAYLMVYKGLYATPANPASSSGLNSMLLFSLESALLDGADVVNNSWGGGAGGSPAGSPYLDVFAAMKDAGVVTVFSAGNSGPGPQTIGCPGCSEDVLTVAATTTNRLFANGISVEGQGAEFQDMPALFSGAVPIDAPITAPVIYAGELEAANFEGCLPFDDGAFAGSMALISRGSCSFAQKIANAEAAGAVAAVIFNADGRGEAPIFMGGLSPSQSIPSVMMTYSQGAALADLASASDDAVNATLSDEIIRTTSEALADNLADFSSRGPNGDPSFLKPEIAAPGVRIFSGESPEAPGHVGENFSFKGGTSMAAPHVAGAAALLRQMHPDWSSDQIKSALVSSSIRDVRKEDAATPADNFDMGAGRLDMARAATAQLTYSELTLADNACYQVCSFTFSVTNTSDGDVSVDSMVMFDDPAVDGTLSIPSATLPAGATAELTLEVDVTAAQGNSWTLGGINWTDNNDATTDYFMPVAVYPISSDDPNLVSASNSVSTASPGELFSSEATIVNQAITGQIELVSHIDPKAEIDLATISAVKNGDQQPATYNADTHSVHWTGALNILSFDVQPDNAIADLLANFGLGPFLSMGAIGVTPLTCSSVCDDTWITLNTPPITYLGKQYTSMQVSSNGFVSLGTSSGNVSSPFAVPLPDVSEPNNVIAPMWADFDLDGTSDSDTGAGVLYAASLTTGHFVVEWSNVELWGSPGETFSFQIWFEYDTGNTYFVYGNLGAVPAGYNITIGAENESGTAGITQAYISANGVQGVLPGSLDQWALNSAPGDSISLSYASRVADIESYNADMLAVMEDASVTANLLSNDLDTTITNDFVMRTLSGDLRAFSPVQISLPDYDASTLAVVDGPQNGSVEILEDGHVTYTPDTDFFGTDSFTYAITTLDDETGESAKVGSVSVEVAGVQDAPVLSVSAPSSVVEGETIVVSASASDADGDSVTITINGVETNRVSVEAPGTNDGGTTVNFRITASDGNSTVSQDVSVAVTNKKSGTIGLIALLLLPLIALRRRKTLH